MKVKPYCGVCLLNRGIKEVELATSDPDLQFKIVKELIKMFQEKFNENNISAHIGTYRDRIIKKLSGCKDPYAEQKRLSNKIAVKFLPFLQKKLNSLKDPYKRFRFAVLASIVGNSIEFHIEDQKIELDSLEQLLKQSFENAEKNLVKDDIQDLFNLLKSKKKVLYLTDNAGEIVFDYILINELYKLNKEVIVAVKEKPVLNDATIEDAKAAGLLELSVKTNSKVKIITTGTDHVGIILSETPKEFLEIFNKAELIIAKGMGYYESLSGEKLPTSIAYLFKIKCRSIAEELKKKINDYVVLLKRI
ncbi:MAG: DUF89 family protein [Candidatus Helarchaeota archaeon]|nr:DUF89 family protein [Candidatus Helarchaeota archaeon]